MVTCCFSLGVGSQPDQVIVVSPHEEKIENDRQPLTTSAVDSFFPSPPPSPLSNPGSPFAFAKMSVDGKNSHLHPLWKEELGLKHTSNSVASNQDTPPKQNHRKPPKDTQKTNDRSTPALDDQSALVMNPGSWVQSSNSLHTNIHAQAPQPLHQHNQFDTLEIKKRFVCGYCSSSFSQSVTLNNHIRLQHDKGRQERWKRLNNF